MVWYILIYITGTVKVPPPLPRDKNLRIDIYF